ncbi:MAG: 50S ribosomal protein L25/general stress protein Ctc [Mailhella sp.]|nr:50S ribosomal protein L25/general stress protein Ctc [Mailhella sp.]
MAEMITLSVQKREGLGKGPNRRLRVQDLVPGVYYAPDGTNIPVQMKMLPVQKAYEKVGRTNVFNLEIDDNGTKTAYPCFVWDAQYHPVKNTFTHLDFFGVDLDKEIKIKVRVKYVGTAKGVKVGGVQEVYREEVTLSAKPLDMPREVVIDVTDLELGKSIRASEVKLPEGVSIVYKNDFNMVSVISPDAAPEEAAAEA